MVTTRYELGRRGKAQIGQGAASRIAVCSKSVGGSEGYQETRCVTRRAHRRPPSIVRAKLLGRKRVIEGKIIIEDVTLRIGSKTADRRPPPRAAPFNGNPTRNLRKSLDSKCKSCIGRDNDSDLIYLQSGLHPGTRGADCNPLVP